MELFLNIVKLPLMGISIMGGLYLFWWLFLSEHADHNFGGGSELTWRDSVSIYWKHVLLFLFFITLAILGYKYLPDKGQDIIFTACVFILTVTKWPLVLFLLVIVPWFMWHSFFSTQHHHEAALARLLAKNSKLLWWGAWLLIITAMGYGAFYPLPRTGY